MSISPKIPLRPSAPPPTPTGGAGVPPASLVLSLPPAPASPLRAGRPSPVPGLLPTVLFAAVALAMGGCAKSMPSPSLALEPEPTENRPVFMGFDFNAPVEWAHRDKIGIMYIDRCEELGVGYSFFRLDPPWHGFDKALAWGDDGSDIVQGLKCRREEPMSFDWRSWAEDVVRSFREDFGMELRLLEPKPGYEGYDAQYVGGEGEFRAFLSVGHLIRFESDGIRVKSKSRLLEVEVSRFDATLPGPTFPFGE